MTDFHPTTRQPLTPGTPDHTAFAAEQTSRVMWSQLEQQRREQDRQAQVQHEDASPSVAATYYPPPGGFAPQQPGKADVQAPMRPSKWRVVGWILAVLAALWTLGAVYEVGTGRSVSVSGAVWATACATGAWIIFLTTRRRRRR